MIEAFFQVSSPILKRRTIARISLKSGNLRGYAHHVVCCVCEVFLEKHQGYHIGHSPVIKLHIIKGRIINFSILSSSSPGNTKYSIWRLLKFASRIATPTIIPSATPARVAKSRAFSLHHVLHWPPVQHAIADEEKYSVY